MSANTQQKLRGYDTYVPPGPSAQFLCQFESKPTSTSVLTELGPDMLCQTTAILDTGDFKFGTASIHNQNGLTLSATGIAGVQIAQGNMWRVEGWAKFSDRTGSLVALHFPGTGHYLIVTVDSTSFSCSWISEINSGGSWVANYTWPLNTWVHWAVQRDLAGTIKLYANGIMQGTLSYQNNQHSLAYSSVTLSLSYDNGHIGARYDSTVFRQITDVAELYPASGAYTIPTAAFSGSAPSVANNAVGLLGRRLAMAKGILGKSLSANSLTLSGQRIISRGGIAKLLGDQATKIFGQRMVARLGAMIGQAYSSWNFSRDDFGAAVVKPNIVQPLAANTNESPNYIDVTIAADGTVSYVVTVNGSPQVRVYMQDWATTRDLPEGIEWQISLRVQWYGLNGISGPFYGNSSGAGFPVGVTYRAYHTGVPIAGFFRLDFAYGQYPSQYLESFQGTLRKTYAYELGIDTR